MWPVGIAQFGSSEACRRAFDAIAHSPYVTVRYDPGSLASAAAAAMALRDLAYSAHARSRLCETDC